MQPQDKNKRKQKLLVALPLFVIGLAGLIVGGINIMGKRPAQQDVKNGMTKSAFNTKLPAPNLPGKDKNKLEIYMEADKDSAHKKAEWENDPNSKRLYDPAPPTEPKRTDNRPVPNSGKSNPSLPSSEITDPNEKKVNERLQKLYAVLNQSANQEKQEKGQAPSLTTEQREPGQPDPETARLERLLQAARTPDTASDPTLDKVDKVLDKVLDIQHPERVQVQVQKSPAEGKRTIYKVLTSPEDAGRTEPDSKDGVGGGENAFYGLQQTTFEDSTTNNNTTSIQAVVHETQILQNGSTIKLRLLQDIFVGGHRIPANNFIYGQCSVNSERLTVQLTSAVCNDQIYPIALKVYDMDGLEGIYVPGAITREVTKEGISQGITGMGITSLDPSLGAQAAAAGIETAKNLLSKKVKAVIVTVKAGHRVLLENPGTVH
jgi:conjugative transposon TraM protein